MKHEDIVLCAICNQPQKVNLQELNRTLKKHSDTTFKANDTFICHDCINTERYKKNYFKVKDKPHVALTENAKVI